MLRSSNCFICVSKYDGDSSAYTFILYQVRCTTGQETFFERRVLLKHCYFLPTDKNCSGEIAVYVNMRVKVKVEVGVE